LDLNDLEQEKKKPEPINLEVMSVEALNTYIRELQDEIERVKNEIASKKAARVGAESIFKNK
jgi:uncharacterized small protein (DUF1192 family)